MVRAAGVRAGPRCKRQCLKKATSIDNSAMAANRGPWRGRGKGRLKSDMYEAKIPFTVPGIGLRVDHPSVRLETAWGGRRRIAASYLRIPVSLINSVPLRIPCF